MTGKYIGSNEKYNACTGSIIIPFATFTYDSVKCLPPMPDVSFEGISSKTCTLNSGNNKYDCNFFLSSGYSWFYTDGY
jgi:hypothetical protein